MEQNAEKKPLFVKGDCGNIDETMLDIERDFGEQVTEAFAGLSIEAKSEKAFSEGCGKLATIILDLCLTLKAERKFNNLTVQNR